jgi:hypothetical protein
MPPSSGSKLTETRCHTVGDPTLPEVERPGREISHSPTSSA